MRQQNQSCEIIKDRLYFDVIGELSKTPACTANQHYFCTDDMFVYMRFFEDFGPLNLAMIYRYCHLLNQKLENKSLSEKMIIHYTRTGSRDAQIKRVNAAFLMGAFIVICLELSPDEAFNILSTTEPYITFRDASYGPCSYQLTLLNCLKGLHKAMIYKFFDFLTFDVDEYEYFERVENGDLNWIIEGKFIAFCGPKAKNSDASGISHKPEFYVPYFKSHNVRAVVRLNKALYKSSRFTNSQISHHDLYFIDGGNPSDEILQRFLNICEAEPGAIAVHCKAGLGRTGTVIGCYIMKHYGLTADETIAWLRIARPGCVIGPQQQYMIDKQASMWRDGEEFKVKNNVAAVNQTDTTNHNELSAVNQTDTTNHNELSDMSDRVELMNINECNEREQLDYPPPVQLEVVIAITNYKHQLITDENEETCGDEGEEELNVTQGDLLLNVKRKRLSNHLNKTKKRLTRLRVGGCSERSALKPCIDSRQMRTGTREVKGGTSVKGGASGVKGGASVKGGVRGGAMSAAQSLLTACTRARERSVDQCVTSLRCETGRVTRSMTQL